MASNVSVQQKSAGGGRQREEAESNFRDTVDGTLRGNAPSTVSLGFKRYRRTM